MGASAEVEAYLRYGTDDLYCHLFAVPHVNRSDDFAERALTEKRDEGILVTKTGILVNDVVPVFIVNLLRWLVPLYSCQSYAPFWALVLVQRTSCMALTMTSFCFLNCFGGGAYSPYSAK